MKMEHRTTYSVYVDGVELKRGLSKQDADDLRKSFAGVVKEDIQTQVLESTNPPQRATQ
jgi:hypothetical protein